MPAVLPAKGEKRGRVVLLKGCVQDVLAPEITFAAAHVLAANGIEVLIPEKQGCCGSILLHVGEDERAQKLARQNFDLIPQDVDAIITTAAGCGSGMKDYELLFKGMPEEEKAAFFSEKVMDLSVYLAQIGLRDVPGATGEKRVVLQDACHLYHAQGHRTEARTMLSQLPGITIAPINEAEMCCGSAGTYNIEQPEIAAQLGQRKVTNILAAQPDIIVSSNIGCMMQLRTHLAQQGSAVPGDAPGGVFVSGVWLITNSPGLRPHIQECCYYVFRV